MNERKSRSELEAARLLDEMERYSEAIAQFLQNCGSSRNFGPEQRRQFEKLMGQRRKLLANLERLRQGKRPPTS
jgi:hypothetical protein